MAVSATEKINNQLSWEGVVSADELLQDHEVVNEANDFIRSIGSLAIEGSDREGAGESQGPIACLKQAIERAAKGDPEAKKMVETNVACDVFERTIKAGFVLSVDLFLDESGNIAQYGQSLESVQSNTLGYTQANSKMRPRTEAETRNVFRLQQSYNRGYLKDYSFVVISRVADNMTKKEKKKAGFFTDTMSCAIQVTSLKNGQLAMESAFVAGVKEPGGWQHDEQAVAEVGQTLGQDLKGKSAAEIIDTPLLIPNSLIPNGVVDLVKLYDDFVDEITGSYDSFFGESKPKQDYLDFKMFCQARQALFQTKIDQITTELIAGANSITTPIDATERLDKLSQKHMVEHSIDDLSINPMVFGSEAAVHIMMARWHRQMGNDDLARQEMKISQRTARSNSCPSGFNDTDPSGSDNSSDEDCEFPSKECPVCRKKNVWTTVSAIRGSHGKKLIRGSCGCSKIA